MVYFTQISATPRSASTKSVKLWDPSKTLEVINPDNDSLTCNGHAPSQGRRCRNVIRADNRALIMRTLDEIAYLPPDSPAVMSRLRAIVGPALCVRNHQGQADILIMNWQRKVRLVKSQAGERKPAKVVQTGRLQKPALDIGISEAEEQLKEIREVLESLRERMDSQRHQSQEYEGSLEDCQEEARRRRDERTKETRRMENERVEKERLEAKRLADEKIEDEEKKRQENERAAKERLRQRAQKLHEERERERERLEKERLAKEKIEKKEKKRQQAQREMRGKEQKEREEWNQLWANYQENWACFKASDPNIRHGNIRDAIPWPVKSGSYRDANSSTVREFFEKAHPKDQDIVKLMRKECLKWHPDKRHLWLPDSQINNVDTMLVEMICRVITDLMNKSDRKSS
jgi:hypothetical protein